MLFCGESLPQRSGMSSPSLLRDVQAGLLQPLEHVLQDILLEEPLPEPPEGAERLTLGQLDGPKSAKVDL
jgi:hypothetical protein